MSLTRAVMLMSLTRAVTLMSLTRVVMLMSLTRAVDTGLDHKGNLNELRRRVFNLVIKQPKVLGECSSRIEMCMMSLLSHSHLSNNMCHRG